MSWTDERVERLSAMWLEGRSASQIAAELGDGVSRNAVIGKIHRLGLASRAVPPAAEAAPFILHDVSPDEAFQDLPDLDPDLAEPILDSPGLDPTEPALAAEPAPEPIAEVRASHTLDDIASILEAAPEPITVDLPALRAAMEAGIPISDRVTILELNGSMCRWPIGDPTNAEFRFCGCQATGTLPYCEGHARIAFQPVADRRRMERLIRIA